MAFVKKASQDAHLRVGKRRFLSDFCLVLHSLNNSEIVSQRLSPRYVNNQKVSNFSLD
jgi:hypothetical protein